MMKYIVVKAVSSRIVEYGKEFDNANDAIEQAERLNQLARKNDWADIVQFMVLPMQFMVLPKGAECSISS